MQATMFNSDDLPICRHRRVIADRAGNPLPCSECEKEKLSTPPVAVVKTQNEITPPAPDAKFVHMQLLEIGWVRVLAPDHRIYDLPRESLEHAQQLYPGLIVLQRT